MLSTSCFGMGQKYQDNKFSIFCSNQEGKKAMKMKTLKNYITNEKNILKKMQWGWEYRSVVNRSPSICKTLGSIPIMPPFQKVPVHTSVDYGIKHRNEAGTMLILEIAVHQLDLTFVPFNPEKKLTRVLICPLLNKNCNREFFKMIVPDSLCPLLSFHDLFESLITWKECVDNLQKCFSANLRREVFFSQLPLRCPKFCRKLQLTAHAELLRTVTDNLPVTRKGRWSCETRR